jgi:hypothetical protein
MTESMHESESMELAVRVRSWMAARSVDHKPFVCDNCLALTDPYHGDTDGVWRLCTPCWALPYEGSLHEARSLGVSR